MLHLTIDGVEFWHCQGCGTYRPAVQFPEEQCFVYYCEHCMTSGLAQFDWSLGKEMYATSAGMAEIIW